MNTLLMSKWTTRVLVLSTAVALNACGAIGLGGGDDSPTVAPVIPATPVPGTSVTPGTVTPGSDYVRQYILPIYQQTYGSMQFLQPVTLGSTSFAANRTYTWLQVYDVIMSSMQGSACLQTAASAPNVWAGTNYGCYYNSMQGQFANWSSQGMVYFAQVNRTTYFLEVFNEIVSLNYSFYQQYGSWYGNQFGMPGYYYQGQPWTNPTSGNYVQGGLNYNNNGGWNIGFGGTFRF